MIKGLLAPFLLLGIFGVLVDKDLMLGQSASLRTLVLIGLTTILMFGAAIGMFVFGS